MRWSNYWKMGRLRLLIRKGLTWQRLSATELSLLLQALVLLPLVSLSLQLWGLQRTKTALAWLPTQDISLPSQAQVPLVAKTARMVHITTRYSVLWTTCLKKSLVLWCLLRRQGITSELRIGVQRDEGEFTAHGWVEYQGLLVGDYVWIGENTWLDNVAPITIESHVCLS